LTFSQAKALIQVRAELVERADQHVITSDISASVAGRPPGPVALLQAQTEESRTPQR